MRPDSLNFQQIKKRYLKFLKSQEITSEPFRDKQGQLKNFYLPICKKINSEYVKRKKTKIIGLSGGQGTGKSTISQILKIILKEGFNLETVIFSIDDFYKTRKDRKIMAKKISPLFLTRGVPGTHDAKMLFNCIKNLKKNRFKKVTVPKFDKSKDDRSPKSKWLAVKKKPNIVIFEGWCVGVTSQKEKDLVIPINKLEKQKDEKRIWRQTVNKELKNKYRKIFNLIDKLIFLKVPSFKYVYKWRLLQEKKLRTKSRGNKTMSNEQVKNFIMYYERLTKNMLKILPKKANTVISIDESHRLKSIKFN
jgi:D-glycerate 3-kinase